MADSEENVENGSSMNFDKRLLENERWHSYLGNDIQLVSENIAHHWKCKKEIKLGIKNVNVDDSKNPSVQIVQISSAISNFTIFFKTEFLDCQRKRLLLYMIIVVILGIIASSVVTLLDSLIPSKLVYSWCIWIGVIIFFVIILFLCLRKSTKA